MADVASDLIGNIESYQQLLSTLSLGVAAGSFGLLTQVIFHNAQRAKKVKLKATNLILAAIVIQLVSILFGVFTKSALVSSVPAIHAIQWGNSSATKYLNDAGLQHIMLCSVGQIISFGAGMVILFVVLLKNRHLFGE